MKNMTGFKNADGEYDTSSDSTGILGTGISWGDVFTGGVSYLTNEQKQKQLEQTRAIEEERRRQAEADAKAAAAKAKGADKTSMIKAYGVPIAIGGGLIIVGIAAYFFFKKKKIN